MKKAYLFLIIALLLAACVRPAPERAAPPPPTATYLILTDLFEEPTATETPGRETEPAPATEEAGEEEGEEPTPTSEDSQPEPTEAEGEPTSEPAATEEPTAAPTNTPRPEPTATQSPVTGAPDLDPIAAFGAARFDDQFADGGQNWVGNDGNLPDTDNIQLVVEDQIMAVTGKQTYFDTWWFSAPIMGDMYIEATINSGQCTDDDAYGLILRGAKRGEPVHGYIVAFTCEGDFFVRRLDAINPYTVEAIFIPTESEYIHRGANRENVLGVLIRGEEFTVYANNFQIATFTDATYELGRYGVFVSPGPTENYTYFVSRLRVWDLRAK